MTFTCVGYYPTYVNSSYNTTSEKKKRPDLNRFFQKENADYQQAHEKILNIAYLSGRTKKKQTNVSGYVKKRELSYTIVENINWYHHCIQHCGSISKN